MLSRKNFLKLAGSGISLFALQHFIPTVAFAEGSSNSASSAGLYVSEIIDLTGLSSAEQQSIFIKRNIFYDPATEYEKIIIEEPIVRANYNGVQYRFQTTYGNKPIVNERRSVLDPGAAFLLDRGVNILIGLQKPYIWVPFTMSGLTPSQIFRYSDPRQYASTSIYTHLTTRQCEFYEDNSWHPSAFLQKATIEDTTTTYALVDPKTKLYSSETAKKTTERKAPNYSNDSYILQKAYYCFIHNLPSYSEQV